MVTTKKVEELHGAALYFFVLVQKRFHATQKTEMSYVRLFESDKGTVFYGIHPSIVHPGFEPDHYIILTEPEQVPHLKGASHFPITDRKAPSQQVLSEIVDLVLSTPGDVYIACKGGHGRSGLVAAAAYGKHSGKTYAEVIKFVRSEWRGQRDLSHYRPIVRKIGSPQTAVQKRSLRTYMDALSQI